MTKQIKLANPRGFCAGVDRAIDIVNKALDIYGFARVDFFMETNSNKIFLNEINTIPGFTNQSMFPMLWKASGLNIDQLVAKLIENSLELID